MSYRDSLRSDLAFVERELSKHADPDDTVAILWGQHRQALLKEITEAEADSQDGSQEGEVMELLQQVDAKMKVLDWVDEKYDAKDLEALIEKADKLWQWLIEEG